MNWNFGLTAIDYAFITAFVVLYLLFFVRTIWVARQLGLTAWAVIPKFFLRSAYIALIVTALLGPSFGEAERELVSEGKDIYLAVDLSKSMDAPDIPPTRLVKTKFELERVVKALPGYRFGLIVFSTEAFVHAPLTSDQGALASFIQSLDTRLLPESGTNLCSAAELALRKQINEQTPHHKKVVVLLTDGENFAECNPALFSRLRNYDIALIVVGIGSAAGSPVPTPGGPLRDGQGRLVQSRLQRDYLRQLARLGGGTYLEVSSAADDLQPLVGTIERLENRLIDRQKVSVASNKYYYFLLAALILLGVDLLVPVRTFKL